MVEEVLVKAVPGRIHRFAGRLRHRAGGVLRHGGPPGGDVGERLLETDRPGIDPERTAIFGRGSAGGPETLDRTLQHAELLLDAAAELDHVERVGTGEGETIDSGLIQKAHHRSADRKLKTLPAAPVGRQQFVVSGKRSPATLAVERRGVPEQPEEGEHRRIRAVEPKFQKGDAALGGGAAAQVPAIEFAGEENLSGSGHNLLLHHKKSLS